jgi:hypothetical protein
MKVLTSWHFSKTVIPLEEKMKRRSIAKFIDRIACANNDGKTQWDLIRGSETVFITGDGMCLSEDVKEFESWGIPHDLFCCNRSMLYFQRPVRHWCAVDSEESMWFTEHFNETISPSDRSIIRHVIGYCPDGYDFFWYVPPGICENEYQKQIWAGNSGYFAILASIEMGYKKLILGGMPLDCNPHWYEPESEYGPNWVGAAYRTWMDFKMQNKNADRVRSMSAYTAFILGKATKEWASAVSS